MAFIQQRIRSNPLRAAGDGFYEFVPQPYQLLRSEHGWDRSRLLAAQDSELIIDYRSALSGSSDPQATQKEEWNRLEERLRVLERLREQGLITEEEYRQKRAALLERL
jgi:hypothetical protein